MSQRAKLGEILREAGLLDEAGLKNALAEKAKTGKRLGETLVELNIITEDQLYWALSRQLQVPLIPESKLMMVDVPPEVLRMVPAELAMKRHVLPLLVETQKKTISIVTSEPNVVGVLEEIKRQTGMAYVRAFLAKRTAVLKAIKAAYENQPASGNIEPMDPLGAPAQKDITDTDLILDQVAEEQGGPPRKPIGRLDLQPKAPLAPAINSAPPPPPPPASSAQAGPQPRIVAKFILLADPSKQVAQGAARILINEGFEVEIATTEHGLIEKLKGRHFDLCVVKQALTANLRDLEQRVRTVFPMIEFRIVQSFGTAVLGEPVQYVRLAEFTFDALDSVLSLVPSVDAGTRKRARQLAQYGKLVAQRVSAPKKAVDETYFAGLLEGFGPALARRRGGDAVDKTTARTVAMNTFANTNPPFDVAPILRHLDERMDGSGKPDGLRGEMIPLSSRILAVVAEYVDATEGSGIPREQAIKLLRDMAGRMYDQRIVEAFLSILRNEMLLGNLSAGVGTAGGEEILIVDKDVATTSTLEMRLVNEGYKVTVASDGKKALEVAQRDPPAAIISEIALPKMDGFNLCMEIKADERTANVPFFFLSGKSDEFNMTKGLEMGADDFLSKPVNIEFLMTKLKRFVDRSPAKQQSGDGVSGRLAEMGLVEMVQILGVGMKTVKIELHHPRGDVGEIYFQEGSIVSVNHSEKAGNEAFYGLVSWPPDTTFRIVPNVEAGDRNITVGNDFLILEALRRVDEAGAGIDQEGKVSEGSL